MRSSLFSNRRYALDSSPPSCVPTVAASKCILRRRRPLLNPIKGASQVRRMLLLSDSCGQGCTQPCMECTIMQIRSSRARLLPVPVSVYYPLHPTGCDGAPPHTVGQLQTHGEKVMTPQGVQLTRSAIHCGGLQHVVPLGTPTYGPTRLPAMAASLPLRSVGGGGGHTHHQPSEAGVGDENCGSAHGDVCGLGSGEAGCVQVRASLGAYHALPFSRTNILKFRVSTHDVQMAPSDVGSLADDL